MNKKDKATGIESMNKSELDKAIAALKKLNIEALHGINAEAMKANKKGENK